MLSFLRMQFRMGRIGEVELLSFVPRWLTEEEAKEILKGEKQNEQLSICV